MTPNILEAMKYKFDVGSTNQNDYTWFDLGAFSPPNPSDADYINSRAHLPALFDSEQLPEDIPMPFERIGIVSNYPGMDFKTLAITVERTENNTCTLAVVRQSHGALCQLLHDGERAKRGEPDFSFDGYDPRWGDAVLALQQRYNPDLTKEELTEQMHDEYAGFLQHLFRVLYWEMMHKLVDKKEPIKAIQPIPNPSNAKRIAKGKKPLFEWKVIEVSGVQQPPPTAPTGRTHASPRLHKRRGHLRKYKNGKTLWIKEMMVGKIEFGYIHHSYKAS